MKRFYLALAVVGTIVPYFFFLRHFDSVGLSPADFVGGLFVNGAAAGFTADLLISSLVFWIWLIRCRVPRPWIYILLNLTIGLSCALPASLYAREGTASERPIKPGFDV